ncbi:hypothetical protein BGZ83_006855 [Gryganskiella cystojenkinii]|nr:hypothetical protein BGZ83_006855 [Gryganskiella cystojenkinii]
MVTTGTDLSAKSIPPQRQQRAQLIKNNPLAERDNSGTYSPSASSSASSTTSSQPQPPPPTRTLQFINRHAPVVPRPKPQPSSDYVQSSSARQQQIRKQKREGDKIKRVSNCFIKYRTDMHPWIVRKYGNQNNKEISRLAGRCWRAEPESVKSVYRQQALEEKQKHASLYPSYKYAPSRGGSAAASAATAAQSSSAVETTGTFASTKACKNSGHSQTKNEDKVYEGNDIVSSPAEINIGNNSASPAATNSRNVTNIKRKRGSPSSDAPSSSSSSTSTKRFYVTETALHDFVGDTVPKPPAVKKVKIPKSKKPSIIDTNQDENSGGWLSADRKRPVKVTRTPDIFPTTVAYEFTTLAPIMSRDNSKASQDSSSLTITGDNASRTDLRTSLPPLEGQSTWNPENESASLVFDSSLSMSADADILSSASLWAAAGPTQGTSSTAASMFTTSLMDLHMPDPLSWPPRPPPPPLVQSQSPPFPTPPLEDGSPVCLSSVVANSTMMSQTIAPLPVSSSLEMYSPGIPQDFVSEQTTAGAISSLGPMVDSQSDLLSWTFEPLATAPPFPSPAPWSLGHTGSPLLSNNSNNLTPALLPMVAPTAPMTTPGCSASSWSLTSPNINPQQQQQQQQKKSPLLDLSRHVHATFQWAVPDQDSTLNDMSSTHHRSTGSSSPSRDSDHGQGSNYYGASGSTNVPTAPNALYLVTADHARQQQALINSTSNVAATPLASLHIEQSSPALGNQGEESVNLIVGTGDCESEEELSRSIEFYERIIQQQKTRLLLQRHLKSTR